MRRPKFIAEQARHAKGLLGKLIASIMARETRAHNLRAIDALDIVERDHILDVGCGPGRSLMRLAGLAKQGRIVGIDPSPLMVEIALRNSRRHGGGTRVDVVVASAARLPFDDASFDKALCVHVVYFWNDLPGAFNELARVLRPRGRLALLFRTSSDAAAVRAFPAEVYRFPAPSEVIAPLEAAGFVVETLDQGPPGAPALPVLLIATRR